MKEPSRGEIVAGADLIVVKVGSRVLTDSTGVLDESRVRTLAEELHRLMEDGRKVALVSSGAVAAGMGRLGMRERPRDLATLQAVAAVGQCYLVREYDRALESFGRHAAQVLLTADDLDDRARYLNARNTILRLLDLGALPIINENDTVSVEELQTTFGDNDRLAAMVTNLIRAPLLILLSDVAGLYDDDPREPGARVIPTVKKLDDAIFGLVRDKLTGLSKGGMASKLAAARIATRAGENVIIANGHEPGVLARLMAGEELGTWFVAPKQAIPSYKRWIGYTAQVRGGVMVDAGARKAVVQDGRSLLAIGVVEIAGDFVKGDVVALLDPERKEFARGLINYSALEARKIVGLKTDQIASALGHCPYQEVIHRDNMAVTALEPSESGAQNRSS